MAEAADGFSGLRDSEPNIYPAGRCKTGGGFVFFFFVCFRISHRYYAVNAANYEFFFLLGTILLILRKLPRRFIYTNERTI